MAPLIATLRTLPRTDLVDLLTVITDRAVVSDEDIDAALCDRVVDELFRLCGLPAPDGAPDEALLERHLVSRLANRLCIDYDPAEDTTTIAARLERYISDCVVEDLRPFIQVSVCIGWADGRLAPEEIAVMDAALSRLKLLARRRAELLALCSRPITADQMKDVLEAIVGDDQKAWSVLALGWAVALADMKTVPAELQTFRQLAAHLGVAPTRAEALRELVTRRFADSLQDRPHTTRGYQPGALAKATMAAITAVELDSYLHAATGLKSLSLMLSSTVRVGEHRDSMAALDAMLDAESWVGAPAVLAGALFLRRLGGDELAGKLLVVVLTCLERTR
jgi:tellurite resistance protein